MSRNTVEVIFISCSGGKNSPRTASSLLCGRPLAAGSPRRCPEHSPPAAASQPATESINYSGHSCYSRKSQYTIQVTYIIHCVYICTGIDKVNGVHDVAVSVGVVQGCKTKLRKDVTCIEY
jgi:hypothetical protein